MSDHAYASGHAMWSAARARAKRVAADHNRTAGEVLREFVYDRLLARVFDDPDEPWVLKGGTALLARVEDARHSLDVDLLSDLADVEEAVRALRRALARDLGDYFAFDVLDVAPTRGADQQPGVDGRTIGIAARVGVRTVERFRVDLVTGSLMTDHPEVRPGRSLIDIAGLKRPDFRLYPAVDHVADKLCATETTYVSGPSSRVRDLVDLVVIARTQTLHLGPLRTAIAGERDRRNLPPRATFTPPSGWGETYSREAATTPHCADLDFVVAAELVSSMLAPALSPGPQRGVWDPVTTAWDLAQE